MGLSPGKKTGVAKIEADAIKAAAREVFLNRVRSGKAIQTSCAMAGFSFRAFKNWTDPERSVYDPEFHEEFKEALAQGTGAIEDEMVRRAVEGVDKNIYHQGEVCGTEKVYSDAMLVRLAAARDERFRNSPPVAQAPALPPGSFQLTVTDPAGASILYQKLLSSGSGGGGK